MSVLTSTARSSLLLLALCTSGCTHWGPQPQKFLKGWGNGHVPPPAPVSVETPKELEMGILPTYRIEPPDVLSLDLINLVPKSPYRLRTTDILLIRVRGTLPEAPIEGQYAIQLGGSVDLGPEYGQVQIAGLDLEAAQGAIQEHLAERLRAPEVSISILSTAGQQQIAGEHLVGPDGTITLGSYGSVLVTGMTLDEARKAIESHLSKFLDNPELSVSVFSYNSKVYYVVVQGAGTGDQLYRFPIMGNETVIDALSQIQGLTPNSSTSIWVARPGGSARPNATTAFCRSTGTASRSTADPRPTTRSCLATACTLPKTSGLRPTRQLPRSSLRSSGLWASRYWASRPSRGSPARCFWAAARGIVGSAAASSQQQPTTRVWGIMESDWGNSTRLDCVRTLAYSGVGLITLTLLAAGCKPWHPYAGRIISYSPFGHTKAGHCLTCQVSPCQCHLRGSCFPDSACHGYRSTTWRKIPDECSVAAPVVVPEWEQPPAEMLPVPSPPIFSKAAERGPAMELKPVSPRGQTSDRFGTAIRSVLAAEPDVRQGRLRGDGPAVRKPTPTPSPIQRTSAEIEPLPPVTSVQPLPNEPRPPRFAAPYVFAQQTPAPSPPTALDELEHDDSYQDAGGPKRAAELTSPEEVRLIEPVPDAAISSILTIPHASMVDGAY